MAEQRHLHSKTSIYPRFIFSIIHRVFIFRKELIIHPTQYLQPHDSALSSGLEAFVSYAKSGGCTRDAQEARDFEEMWIIAAPE